MWEAGSLAVKGSGSCFWRRQQTWDVRHSVVVTAAVAAAAAAARRWAWVWGRPSLQSLAGAAREGAALADLHSACQPVAMFCALQTAEQKRLHAYETWWSPKLLMCCLEGVVHYTMLVQRLASTPRPSSVGPRQ